MNSKSNLQNALKNAFENHEVPLRESQWHRLEGVLINTKPKWRIFPFFITLCLVGITSITTYYLTVKYSITSNPVLLKTSILSSDQVQNKNATSSQTILSDQSAIQLIPNRSDKFRSNSNFTYQKPKFINKQNETTIGKNIYKNPSDHKNPTLLTENSSSMESSEYSETITEIKEDNISKNDIFEEDDLALNKDDEALAPPMDPREKEKDSKPIKPSRMALSVSAGYSKMNSKIIDIENETKLHKDTRSLFEQSNLNSKTFFFNLGVDYSLLPGLNLGLNTGVQYLRISTPVNINYRITEVPFYNIDGTIIGYYKADSANTIELSTSTNNISNFVNIPLRLNYTIPINFKNEILITAGANFMAILGATGKDVALNESQVKPLSKKSYSQFSAGFLGGIQYSHQLKDPWWLGFETQWSSNKLNFKTGPGSVNTQLSGYRLNLILKYKL